MVRKVKAYEWTHEKVGRLLKIDFVRFGMVGATGFIVTFIFKSVYQGFGVPTTLATFLGSEMGLISNFIFHERWTYNAVDHHDKSVVKKFFHFQLSSLSGIVLLTFIDTIFIKITGQDNIIGLAVAAGITMFWNYFWTKFYIFKGKTPSVLMNPEDTVEVEIVK